MKLKRIGLLTSGGDAPGMNAAIRAVVLAANHFDIEIVGFNNGYNGLINEQFRHLTRTDVDGIIQRGGTILKSARCPAMKTPLGIQQACTTLMKEKIDALIVIGGDGSFTGLIELEKVWQKPVIGIPGTIDNDIDDTDFTIGFATAVNTAIDAIDKIRDTAEAFERIFIVEVMGRKSGHLAFNVGISCAAEQIISFENFSNNFDPEKEAEKLAELTADITQAKANRHASYLIVLAENLWQGGATALAQQLQQASGIDCAACVLGYIQRGGSPVAKDRIMATKMGVAAIQAIIDGHSKIMIAEQNNTITHIQLNQAIGHQQRVSQMLVDAQENILAVTAQSQY